ncbi:hypothetical protein JFK97_05680 [Chromobacterium phragmitis]|nr:hypothetical protein [Chromobacterium amazonense]MBM2883874.1 hypothetical protein [Chromobacterium amazonense]MDE1716317.1 hypothetical protein [Chromobacterium amazonense]
MITLQQFQDFWHLILIFYIFGILSGLGLVTIFHAVMLLIDKSRFKDV